MNKTSTKSEISAISDNLELVDGIWYSKSRTDISYPENGNEILFLLEEKSFWFLHRNKCIIEVIKQYPPSGTFYDIGGGNGFVATLLEMNGIETVLIEPGMQGALNARNRGLKNIICSAFNDTIFKKEKLPAVGLFDIIEHIEDDLKFIESIYNCMNRKGRLYLTAPAFNLIWSKNDEWCGHFKRYRLKDLIKLLNKVGFEIKFSSYMFFVLPVPIFFFRSIPGKFGLLKKPILKENWEKIHCQKKGLVGKLISQTFKTELNWIKKNRKVPFGSSCFIVAEKY